MGRARPGLSDPPDTHKLVKVCRKVKRVAIRGDTLVPIDDQRKRNGTQATLVVEYRLAPSLETLIVQISPKIGLTLPRVRDVASATDSSGARMLSTNRCSDGDLHP